MKKIYLLIIFGIVIACLGLFQIYSFDVSFGKKELLEIFRDFNSVLTGFSAIVFVLIWQRNNQTIPQPDYGLIYLSCALLVWGFVGIVQPNYRIIIGDLASILNNYFILMALYYFDDGSPNYNSRIIKWLGITKTNYTKKILRFTVIFGLTTLFFAILYAKKIIIYDVAPFIDLTFSILTVILLGIALWISFSERGYKGISILSSFVIAIMLICQPISTINDLTPNVGEISRMEFIVGVSLLLYKVLLIFIFGAIAITWHHSKKAKNLDVDRQDMVHMVRNVLTFLSRNIIEQQRINQDTTLNSALFFEQNYTRIEAVRNLFDEIFHKKYLHSNSVIDLENFIDKIMQNLKSTVIFEKNSFHYKRKLSGIRFVNGEPSLRLASIIIESVFNAYKHGGGWVLVTCVFSTDKKSIAVKIRDRGIGKVQNNKNGFGLSSIDKNLEYFKGTKSIKKLNKRGNEFSYVLPIIKFMPQ